MTTALYIVLSVLFLGILIMVHEGGHFTVAKAFHFPVAEFSVGMGPKIIQKEKNGTKYSLRAIPMGGYVAFEDVDDAEQEELVFQQQPLWQRFFVLLAGPGMNIVIAVIMVFCMLFFRGTALTVPRVASVGENTAAAAAGLQEKDTFLKVNGESVDGDYTKFSELISQYAADGLDLTVLRDGNEISVFVQPEWIEEEQRYYMGIYMDYDYFRYPFGQAVKGAFVDVKNMVVQLYDALGGMFTGKYKVTEMTGVVGTVAMVAEIGAESGFWTVFYLFAFISVNLGIMNLLPLPALDGGKILLLGVELIRGKPMNPKYEGILSIVGLALFALLFLLITGHDVYMIATGGWFR